MLDKTTASTATFTGLMPNTEYFIINTYICNSTNDNYDYNYDNYIAVTTEADPNIATKTVFINDNNIIKSGSLYTSPNGDSNMFKVLNIYARKNIESDWILLK